jgi:hypothetical protein
VRIGRWSLVADDSGERNGVWLFEIGGEAKFFEAGDLNTLMRLFTGAWKQTRPTRRCRYCRSTGHFGDTCPTRHKTLPDVVVRR